MPRKAEAAKATVRQINLTVDEGILPLLMSYEDRLAEQLGFRPTHSQALRHLIKNATSAPTLEERLP